MKRKRAQDEVTVETNDKEDNEDPMGGISLADVETAIRVATILGSRLELFRSRPFKNLRVALHPIVTEQVNSQIAESVFGSY